MIERPTTPPQIIRAGDMWSKDVDIWLDGEKAGASWTLVDVPKGIGMRLLKDAYGHFVIEDDHAKTEVVRGTFEVRWRDDR